MSFLDLIFCVYRFCELDFLKTTGTTSFVRRVPFVRRSFPFLSRDISSATRFFYIDIWRVLFFPFGALVGRNFFRNLFDKRLFTFVPRRTNDRTFSFILRIFFLFFSLLSTSINNSRRDRRWQPVWKRKFFFFDEIDDEIRSPMILFFWLFFWGGGQ